MTSTDQSAPATAGRPGGMAQGGTSTMSTQKRKAPEGIEVRHAKGCRSTDGGRCSCTPTYRAHIWSDRDQKRVRKSFPTIAAAKTWRTDALVALREGRLRAPTKTTVEEAGEAWLRGAREGLIRNRSGDEYKPAALRMYETNLRLRIYPSLGKVRLSEVRRTDLQDLIDELVAEGLAAATVQASVMPLNVIFRRATNRGEVTVNPTTDLDFPAIRNGRDRIASPAEAAQLIAAVPEPDRPVWATAFYTGMRRGELRALRVRDLDLDRNIIHVERGWDDKEGEQPNKSRQIRPVPIAKVLREPLLAHLMRTGRRGTPDAFVFGETDSESLACRGLTNRADRAWEHASLNRVTLHDCRHTFASLMIAAGCNAKALCTYMGHSSITVTFDRYGHLMPGGEEESAVLLDDYLAKSSG